MFFLDNRPIIFFFEYSSITLLKFCESIHVLVPRFCYHDKLTIAGNCRMCLVEQVGSIKPIISCAFNLIQGVELYTDSVFVKRARENVLEFLLINHPLDCPICDQGGECDLQDLSLMFGSDRGRFKEMKRSVSDKFFGPIVKTIMTRCIHCTRCVRFAEEVAGVPSIGVLGRGEEMEISMAFDTLFDTELSGNVADLCPVGALTIRPSAFKSRPWEMKSIECIDPLDSLHSNIRIDTKGNRILRVLPRRNEWINEEWISDLSRFSFESFHFFRIRFPFIGIFFPEAEEFFSVELKKGNKFKYVYFFFENFFFHFFGLRLMIRVSWNFFFIFGCFFFAYIQKYFFLENFISFIGNENGLFHSIIFYYFFKDLLGFSFFFENDVRTCIDFRNSFFFWEGNVKELNNNDCFVFFQVDLKQRLPVLYSRLLRKFYSFSKYPFVCFIGINGEGGLWKYHLGYSIISLFDWIRGSLLGINKFWKFIKKSLNKTNVYIICEQFSEKFNELFRSIIPELVFESRNVLFHSNLPGIFELGFFSDYLTYASFFKEKNQNNTKVKFSKKKNLFFAYKANTLQEMLKNFDCNFFFFQGSYLPSSISWDQNYSQSFVFLPTRNVYEQTDFFLNIFGIFQRNYHVISNTEKEDVVTDLTAVCFFFRLFLISFFNESIFSLFSLCYNKLVVFFFENFCLFFDCIPLRSNYNYNFFSFYSESFFKLEFSWSRYKYDPFLNWYVVFSDTLRSFYRHRWIYRNNFFERIEL